MPDQDDPSLAAERLILRRWLDRDRAPFAQLNAHPEVMRYFVPELTEPESNALVDRIEAQFEERGFGLWAVERREDAAFLGFTGLVTTVSLGFTEQASAAHGTPLVPEVEVGWRFDRTAWGHGYATEAARAALRVGFEIVDLPEIVSFTTPLNVASMRVMERLGMHRDPADDFDHPRIPEGNPLRRHVLYRLTRAEFRGTSDSRFVRRGRATARSSLEIAPDWQCTHESRTFPLGETGLRRYTGPSPRGMGLET